MTISEIIWSLFISIVAGIVTGALFATRSNNKSSPISDNQLDIITNIRIRNSTQNFKQYNYVNYKSSSSNDNGEFILFIGFFVMVIANVFFANYYKQILTTGWSIIVFFDASVISFILVAIIKSRKLILQGFWCILCLSIITYEYLLFNNSVLDPTYINYLNRICQLGIKAMFDSSYNNFWHYPTYQILGLFFLCFAMIETISQTLALLLWPIYNINNLIFKVYRFLSWSLNRYSILIQVIFLIFSYFILSGKIFILIKNLTN